MAQLKTSDFFLLLNVRYRTFRHCSQNLEAVKWKIVQKATFLPWQKKVLKCADGKDRGTSQKRGEKKVLNLARYKVSKNCVAFKNLHSCKVIEKETSRSF